MKKTGFKLQWLLLGSFLGSIGNSFVWPLTTIYIHDQLHQSLTVSGSYCFFILAPMLWAAISQDCCLTEKIHVI